MTIRLSRRAMFLAALGVALSAALPSLADEKVVHFVLAGDSTVTDAAGWGKAFAARLVPGARCTNTASGGQSTKSFLHGNRYKKAMELHPTHVLIQFGHNDMPGKGPDRETDPNTTYRENLIRMITEARAAGATPIIVTSIPRRNFKDGKLVGELKPYVDAAKAVAAENRVPVVDLFARSVETIEAMGPDASEKLGPIGKDGKRDHTHLSAAGAELTTNLLVAELSMAVPDLAKCFQPQPAVPANP